MQPPVTRNATPRPRSTGHLLVGLAACLGLLGALAPAGTARAAAGDLLWASTAGVYEYAFDGQSFTVLAKTGGTAVAAGYAYTSEPVTAAVLRVSAFDGKSGASRWSRDLHPSIAYTEYTVHGIAAKGGRVFVGGDVGGPTGALIALSAKTGVTLWETAITPQGVFESTVLAVAASGSVVYALVEEYPACTVRAFDARSGAHVWSADVGSRCSSIGALDYFNELNSSSLLLKGSKLYVATASWDGSSQVGADVIALDAKSGAEIWRRVFVDCAGLEESRAASLAAAGSRLVVAGVDRPTSPSCSSERRAVLRSLDAKTGATRWERYLDGEINSDDNDGYDPPYPHVVVKGTRVIASASIYDPITAEPDWRIAAFETATGTPLWQRTMNGDNGGNGDGYDAVHRLAVTGKTVVAAGTLLEGGDAIAEQYGEGNRFSVVALDLVDGSTAWSFRRTILEAVDPQSYGSPYYGTPVALALLPLGPKTIVAAGAIARLLDDPVFGLFDDVRPTVVGLAVK